MEGRVSLSSAAEELKSIASEWEKLSSFLNTSSETVLSLKSDGCSEEDGLREILRHWVDNLEDEGKQPPWKILLEAVGNIDQKLADDLKEKLCSTSSKSSEGEINTEVTADVTAASNDAMEEEETGKKESEEMADYAHIYSESWSKLAKEDIIDKIKGVIYGQAIGDALGLATEFMSKNEARAYYEKGLTGYQDIVDDFHRSRWDKGDWTDDTDQMLLILMMVIEKNGRVDQIDFASRLHNWMCSGFKELGDVGGMGIGLTVKRTLTHSNFLKEPARAASDVWESSGRYLAANGAIMRTSILGALSFNDISKVVANTTAIAKVTHADPRCSASCVAVTTAIALMLQGAYDPTKKDQLSKLIEKATEEGRKCLDHKDQQKEMKKHIKSSLKDLQLGDRNKIGYTFKALGSGFYGLRVGNDFRRTITELIMEGGDADSNASVCGALMGCKLGFKSLPEDLLQFKHREWLDKKVDAFLKTTGLI